ncbi:hypothetical protein CC2G_005417 [Coprinopsis cinerea AmutBmut pab1-1]|nr:hypothetical protein CC2G_005417 [Coprinopsis cinerea AmutBmut pab1-1]
MRHLCDITDIESGLGSSGGFLINLFRFLLPSQLKATISIAMSDTGRQSFTDKMGSTMKPDSQKSTMERTGDRMKGTMDSAASSMQPNSQKSTGQQMGDTMSSNSNQNQDSMMDKAKNAMGLGDSK